MRILPTRPSIFKSAMLEFWFMRGTHYKMALYHILVWWEISKIQAKNIMAMNSWLQRVMLPGVTCFVESSLLHVVWGASLREHQCVQIILELPQMTLSSYVVLTIKLLCAAFCLSGRHLIWTKKMRWCIECHYCYFGLTAQWRRQKSLVLTWGWKLLTFTSWEIVAALFYTG